MNWRIVSLKALKYFAVSVAAVLLAAITPEVLHNALSQFPSFVSSLLVPILTGVIAAASNAVKHWND